MKLIQPKIDKDNCYKVIDGQNHYLVSYDYGCYMLKDDQTRLEMRQSWKSLMDSLNARCLYVHPTWSKALGTRGYPIKESFSGYLESTCNVLHKQIQSFVETPELFRKHPSCYEPLVFAIEDGYGEIRPVLQGLCWIPNKEPTCAIDLGTYRNNHYEISWNTHNMVEVVNQKETEKLVFGWRIAKVCVTPIIKPILISSPSKKVEKSF